MDISLVVNLATLISLAVGGYRHFDKKLDGLSDRLLKLEMSLPVLEQKFLNELSTSQLETNNKLQSLNYQIIDLSKRVKNLEGKC